MSEKRVNMAQLARLMGCDRSYIHQLKIRGTLEFDERGLIDEKLALISIENARERMRQPSTNSTFMAARTKRETYAAALSGLDVEERTGALINAKEAHDAQRELAGLVRARLLTVPDRICALIAVESDAARVREILAREIKLALTEALADPEGVAE